MSQYSKNDDYKERKNVYKKGLYKNFIKNWIKILKKLLLETNNFSQLKNNERDTETEIEVRQLLPNLGHICLFSSSNAYSSRLFAKLYCDSTFE